MNTIKRANHKINAQSIDNDNTIMGRSNRALFAKEEYALRNTYKRDDDIDEDNERSTG